MTHSTGFFVNAKTHELRQIYEHASAVVADPVNFGLKPSEINGLHPRTDRFEILSKVMDSGWMRIRRRKFDMSSEFSCSWIEAIVAVAANADQIGYGPMTFLVFRNIETGETMHTYACNVIQAFEEKRIPELLEKKIR
ncbi:MAG: hypothetical protein KC964_04020 [Candidatus Omnitrophica bacterium]|nr:hypothetical protein [Candidatus Omnitrophota bacterium]